MTSIAKLSITELLEQGHLAYETHDYKTALRLFYKAWIQLPKPETYQRDSGKILTSIGSTYFKLGRYQPAIEALRIALTCAQTTNHPFTLLRLGQCLFNSGQQEQGRTYLQRAYRLGGDGLFAEEDNSYKEAIIDLVA